jgi:hypothetical protein
MRSLLPFTASVCALFSCEQRFSSNPPPLAPDTIEPSSSPGGIDALFPPTAAASSVAPDPSHAMTVILCSARPQACEASQTDASAGGSYRVVFGSGHGAIRSRRQAMTDLYEELRNRTASGQRLRAEPHASDTAVPTAKVGVSKASAGGSDLVARCAFHLLDLVDSVGEVTLDRVYESGSSGCVLSLGRPVDGGASPCLIEEPERAHRPDRGGFQF